MPLTLRLIYHSLRSAWVATLIALCAWLFLVGPNLEERRALGLPIGAEEPRAEGLIVMRIARAMLGVAPERSVDIIIRRTQGTIPREVVETMLRDLAAGSVAVAAQRDQSTGGAKFVRVGDP